MPYDLNAMRLLARGGQADIYEIDAGRILRVLRASDPKNTKLLMEERSVMAALRERGVGVPEVYEYTEIGGLPALVMQRITGPSMMDLMLRNPLGMGMFARTLAKLHGDFLRADAPEGLMEIRERADWLVGSSTLLDEADKAFVRSLIPMLPGGRSLLHGDFHPGNILTQGDACYIIDWFGASAGCDVSDIAHTYLLCADKPRVPGEGWLKHRFLKAFATRFGRIYLNEIRGKLNFDMEEFGKWLAVRAAERTVYGQPSEREARASFVKACRKAGSQGVSSAGWHKLL